MTTLIIKKSLLIIWIDEKIDNPENRRYLTELGFKEKNKQVNDNFNHTQLNLNISENINSNCQ